MIGKKINVECKQRGKLIPNGSELTAVHSGRFAQNGREAVNSPRMYSGKVMLRLRFADNRKSLRGLLRVCSEPLRLKEGAGIGFRCSHFGSLIKEKRNKNGI